MTTRYRLVASSSYPYTPHLVPAPQRSIVRSLGNAIRHPGRNLGSFRHRRGNWAKGKGGRFVGSR